MNLWRRTRVTRISGSSLLLHPRWASLRTVLQLHWWLLPAPFSSSLSKSKTPCWICQRYSFLNKQRKTTGEIINLVLLNYFPINQCLLRNLHLSPKSRNGEVLIYVNIFQQTFCYLQFVQKGHKPRMKLSQVLNEFSWCSVDILYPFLGTLCHRSDYLHVINNFLREEKRRNEWGTCFPKRTLKASNVFA